MCVAGLVNGRICRCRPCRYFSAPTTKSVCRHSGLEDGWDCVWVSVTTLNSLHHIFLTWIYSLYITSRHSKLSKRKQAFCLLCPTNDFIITLCFLHKILITYYDSRSCDYLLYRTPCPEKDDTELWVLTLTIPNRFSYLFHWQILHCSTDLTMSCTRSYTTLSENKRELKAIRYWAPCLIHGVRPRPLLTVNSDDMTSNVCCW